MDVYAIRPGDNWVSTIEDAVAASAVMLVLIGSLWAKAGTAGLRRIDESHDHVRLELEAALIKDVVIIPVLIDEALMPPVKDLPVTLVDLQRRQALHIRQETFEADVNRLLTNVRQRLRGKAAMLVGRTLRLDLLRRVRPEHLRRG